jgi:thymidylate kinase
VIALDYTGYQEFPFPSDLDESDQKLKDSFLKLSDDEQLKLLNSSSSYEEFHSHILQYLREKQLFVIGR